ncbi:MULTISPECIES: 1-phosphofructokinase family hexose kinase [Aminobacterium]|jgi:1-phosphofructokinase family hexose kinase|uniref:1-phosphofructokinase family hexose kinase n=1 Tax=Aminobacterium TaxID=81466 RepID=UPI002580F92E|nr:1-phosphofructokinase family hexose kinase [Aminobacterium sp. UBA4834]
MIVTVTLNPAVDEEFVVSEFRPGGWFRSRNAIRTPGGKGINVSMMLGQLGYESAAMGFLAGFNGAYIRDALRRERLTTNFVHVKGETRTNVYIIDETGHVETGLSEPGPYIPEEAYDRFLRNFERMLQRTRLLVLGGSLPHGIPQDVYGVLIRMAKEFNIPTIVDAAGPSLQSALEAGPTIAKIDHRFMSRMSGISLTSLDNIIEVVSKLHDQGVEWAVTSYHVYGDVFFTPQGIYLAVSDRRSILSLFATADALITGLIVGGEERMAVEDRIRFAMACAWEDAMHVEKGFTSREAIEALMPRVQLERLE